MEENRNRIDVAYTPSEKQQLFHGSNADELLYGGAAGGGKSHAIVMEAFICCVEHPNVKAYLFRRTFRELEDTLIHTARKYIPRGLGKYLSDSHTWRFPNGSEMRFRHCEHEADVHSYQGAEMDFLFIDELTHFTQPMYEYLKTRLRTLENSGFRPRVRCTANPGGVGHAWVKAYFVDRHPQGGRHKRKIWSYTLERYQTRVIEFIPAKAIDNPHISVDYIFELEQKPEALRRALLDGDWNAFEGQVFTEWRDKPEHYRDQLWTHVIAPFPVPTHWRRSRSFDWGYVRPFSVGWWAEDPNTGRIYRIAEWYGSTRSWNGSGTNTGLKKDPAQVAQEIAKYEAENFPGMQIAGIADPSIFDESRGESIARQMEREGVYFEPADNARLAGKMQLHYRLRFDENGRPGLYVFSTCRDTIRTIPMLVYSQKANKPEDVDTEGEDHVYDDIRYRLMETPITVPELDKAIIREYDPLSEPVRNVRRMLP